MKYESDLLTQAAAREIAASRDFTAAVVDRAWSMDAMSVDPLARRIRI